MMRSATVWTTLALALLTPSAHAAGPLPQVAVTTCGQIVPPRTLGYLTGDLDCSGFTGGDSAVQYDLDAAITVGLKSKLDLRGFTLIASRFGVLCSNLRVEAHRRAVCEVFNGTVLGAEERGVAGLKLHAHDLTVSDGDGVGVYAYGAGGGIENVTATGNAGDGIRARNMKMRNVAVTGNGGNGILTDKIKIADSTITGNGGGQFCLENPSSCFDLNVYKRPKVENVTCGTSGFGGDQGPPTWGVCSSD